MIRLIIAASLALSSCQTPSILQSPAPCSVTVTDEKTLIIALQTFDTVLTGVDRLVAAGVIKPGSTRAVQIAGAIDKAKIAFQAASAAQRACNSTSYLTAINQAQNAIANINQLIKG